MFSLSSLLRRLRIVLLRRTMPLSSYDPRNRLRLFHPLGVSYHERSAVIDRCQMNQICRPRLHRRLSISEPALAKCRFFVGVPLRGTNSIHYPLFTYFLENSLTISPIHKTKEVPAIIAIQSEPLSGVTLNIAPPNSTINT